MSGAAGIESADLLRKKNFELDRQILLVTVPSEHLYSTAEGLNAPRSPAIILETLARFPRELAGELHAWKDGVQPISSVCHREALTYAGSQADSFDRLLALHEEVSQSFAELVHALLLITDLDLTKRQPKSVFTSVPDPRSSGDDDGDRLSSGLRERRGGRSELFGTVLELDLLGRKRALLDELTEVLGLLEAQGFGGPAS